MHPRACWLVWIIEKPIEIIIAGRLPENSLKSVANLTRKIVKETDEKENFY